LAGTISKVSANNPEFIILRAIYYNQNIPKRLGESLDVFYVALDSLIRKKMLLRRYGKLIITNNGYRYLKKHSFEKIPMIDVRFEDLLVLEGSDRHIDVGISLANQVRERVRNG